MTFRQIGSWKGDIGRRDYLIWGIILFAIKYNLDRLIAIGFGKTWFITDYFIQADKLSVRDLNVSDANFFLVLLLQSLPFIWFGTVLCVKRLRNAALPSWLVIFFFIPFINFILFLLLAALPEGVTEKSTRDGHLDQLMPKSKQGSAIVAVAITVVMSLALTALLINYLNEYGWSLFVGIPFFLGFGSVLLYGYRRTLQYREAIGVAFTSVVFFGIIIFILAFEGIICIVMASPIFFIIAMIGASVGHAIQNNHRSVGTTTFIIPVFIISSLGIFEHQNNIAPPTTHVETQIVIDATRQQVWDQLVAFSEIEEPTEMLFKTGIAYPIHAEIDGRGVGATRKCNFTTGPFVEPITTWDEPNLLAFGVIDQPPPMVEWSIYKQLDILHMEGYFKSEKGQFRLDTLPNGQTLLHGTTWYHHDVWPTFYWKIWSDYILHRIHLRVLTHIKMKAEKK